MMKRRLGKALRGSRTVAAAVAGNHSRAAQLVWGAFRYFHRHGGSFASIREELQALFRMMRAWVNGNYRQISTRHLLTIFAGLLYLVDPIDLIPDFIPGLGFLDDAAALGLVISSVSDALAGFRLWEEDHAINDPAAAVQRLSPNGRTLKNTTIPAGWYP